MSGVIYKPVAAGEQILRRIRLETKEGYLVGYASIPLYPAYAGPGAVTWGERVFVLYAVVRPGGLSRSFETYREALVEHINASVGQEP